MAYTKVTDEDREGKGVTGLPDVPQLTTSEMQEKFDELGNVGIDALNNLIDELEDETGADSLGATVPEGLEAEANVGSILGALSHGISNLEGDSHTHTNKETLDTITTPVKLQYDRISSMLANTSAVSNGITDDEHSIITGHAVVNYVSQMGGGDMLKSMYDADNDGIVDNAEAVQGRTTTTDATAITAPTSTTGKRLPTASAIHTVYEELNTSIDSKIAKSSIKTSQSTSNSTVPSSKLLNTVTNNLTSAIEALSGEVIRKVDSFTVKGYPTLEEHSFQLEEGHVYMVNAITHALVGANLDKGAPYGGVGSFYMFADYFSDGTNWYKQIIPSSIVGYGSWFPGITPDNTNLIAKLTTMYGYMTEYTIYDLPV